MAVVARRVQGVSCRRVDWRPQRLSASFHGRDLFAPIAAFIVKGTVLSGVDLTLAGMVGHDWPRESPKVIYRDGYGNLCVGIRASSVDRRARIAAGDREISYARTFCEVSVGIPFWYENSFGLIELAVNQGRADRLLGLAPGDVLGLID